MSCDTAKKWFVSDRVWKALNEDYALVNVSASSVRGALSILDDAVRTRPASHDGKPITFEEYLEGPMSSNEYQFLNYRRYNLIYADVDDTKPQHKETVVELATNDESEEMERPEFVALREKYAAAMLENESGLVANDMDSIVREAVLDVKTMDFLLDLSPKDQERFLQMASGQSLSGKSRPVMLLLRMLDTKQTTTMGATEGYVVAFDVINNQLIIRPFHSDRDTHPLTKPWSSKLPNDGISFSGTPLDFAESFTRNHRDSSDVFKLWIHGHVANILLEHWSAFSKDFVPGVYDEVQTFKKYVRKANRYVEEILEKTEFPHKEKLGDPDHQELSEGYRELEQALVSVEGEIRKSAVKAKAVGDVRVRISAPLIAPSLPLLEL